MKIMRLFLNKMTLSVLCMIMGSQLFAMDAQQEQQNDVRQEELRQRVNELNEELKIVDRSQYFVDGIAAGVLAYNWYTGNIDGHCAAVEAVLVHTTSLSINAVERLRILGDFNGFLALVPFLAASFGANIWARWNYGCL